MKYYLSMLFIVTVFLLPWFIHKNPETSIDIARYIGGVAVNLANVVLAHDPKTVEEIKNKFNDNNHATRVKVLIVPGHEPGFGGTENGGIKERELVVQLGNILAKYLRNNPQYEVHITRDNSNWNKEFDDYFKNNWDGIIAWLKASIQENKHLISTGQRQVNVPKVYHNKAKSGVAERLYGITKWANENDIDITLHLHFNDYPGRQDGDMGKYSGFSIYIPEKQYYNSSTTKYIADSIFKRVSRFNPVSDLKGESDGIIEDADLIAVGANNTANSASLLIEYGYIAEPQFNNIEVKDLVIKDLAFQTYMGLQDFFSSNIDKLQFYDTTILPYYFANNFTKDKYSRRDVLSLQTALMYENLYPPKDYDKNDCLRTGIFGPCTTRSLLDFQKKYNIKGEIGVGDRTRELLNKKFSIKVI
jgi:N-acetylmuramoyl-L-alanine amidase